ncbi:pilus assembly protein [Tyzzerella sp. An114]|uniref:CpaF family protein n=1 Tax=Tyzzerella sp. An114 TaxID=1965545 RepID=UPI000B4543B3|nr:CpaF family protein [Tyzzerella sp. An114]OUQ55113.1 pilus assembly protein [Tyzzerella sp. An114]
MTDFSEVISQLKDIINQNKDMNEIFEDDDIMNLIRSAVSEYSSQRYLSISEKAFLIETLFDSMRGLGVLEPLIKNPEITEIMVNGPNDIFIERKGRVYKSDYKFPNNEELERIIQNIVSSVNRTVNESSPIVDARLKDGSRVNVVLPPIALDGATVTIRKFPEKPITIDDLLRFGSITKEAAEFLEKLVCAKYNIFISGGTGSGKTTFLNALSNYIPKDERVITIEDSAELQIKGIENLVRLETRNANVEGKGEITMRDLIKSSLRMRPERIVVGEVRGGEALDMLQAMNTGHDGSLSTGHSNSTRDMLSRLETMVLTGAQLPLDAIRQQIASAIDIIIQLSRLRDKSRKVVEICEMIGYKDGEFILNPLYIFEEEKEVKQKVIGKLIKKNELINKDKLQRAGIKL